MYSYNGTGMFLSHFVIIDVDVIDCIVIELLANLKAHNHLLAKFLICQLTLPIERI